MKTEVIISCLKNLKVAHFKEEIHHGGILGTLSYQDYTFVVYLIKDSVCQYIFLEYTINNVKNIKDSVESIKERIIASKVMVKDEDVILQTIFPIFEEKFIEQQINNAICVIEKMTHICKH